MNNEQIIIDTINKIRPFLMSDGGNIEFIKYENNTVYVKLSGACSDCEMIDITMKESIELMIKEIVPEVEQVINIS